MSQTIEDAFIDWLNEEGTALVKDNVDLAEVVGEFVSENFSELLKEEGITVESVLESAIEGADLSETMETVLTSALEDNKFDDQIKRSIDRSIDQYVKYGALTVAIQDHTKEMDERFALLCESVKKQNARIDELNDKISDLKKDVTVIIEAYTDVAERYLTLVNRPWWRFW